MKANKLTVHIAGDLVIDKPVEMLSPKSLFNNGSLENLIANLECPITNASTKLNKTGPNLKSSPKYVSEIKKIGCNILNLSNNHIMDYGEEGLKDTLCSLKEHDIEFFGVGDNLSEANRFFIKDIDGVKLALYGICEHEWSVATNHRAGANPIDVINYIELSKKNYEYDYLIVFIHGGKEYYPYPTPRLQKLSRFFAANGASAVICQHTHIAGCFEEYNNIPIFYGQGNFIFPMENQDTFSWNSGFLIQLNFDDHLTWDILPYKQNQSKGSVYYMEKEEENMFLDAIYRRSKEIMDEAFVNMKWEEKSMEHGPKFMRQLTAVNKRFYNLLQKLKLDYVFFQKEAFKTRRAMIKCETHRELIETYLEKKIEE